jgi:hypothetical protein
MFRQAVKTHWHCACFVGVSNDHNKAAMQYGNGCALDDRHTLTALHCMVHAQKVGSCPVVWRSEGNFRGEIVFESPELDIAIIRSGDPIVKKAGGELATYPAIESQSPELGDLVGFISQLRDHAGEAPALVQTHLGSGFISMFLPPQNGMAERFSVSTGFIQAGFSGSAVFLPNGNIVGVLVECRSFPLRAGEPGSTQFLLPVVAPILPVAKAISTVLAK